MFLTATLCLSALGAVPPHQHVAAPPLPASLARPDRREGALLAPVIAAERAGGRAAALAAAAARRIDVAPDGTIEVELRAQSGGGFAKVYLEALGLDVVSTGKDASVVRVALDRAGLLPSLVAGLESMDVPVPIVTFTGEGIQLTGAANAHSKGATGDGVVVAVIDGGFQQLSNLVDSADLPVPIAKKNFTSTGLEDTTTHGTEVAEVVHQMAPGADLVVIKIGNLSHLPKALAFAKKKGAKIVNLSFGFPGANFSDGTGSAAAAIDACFEDGLLPVVAAGNFGDKHWSGTWVDDDLDKVLEFAAGDEVITFEASVGKIVNVYLTWDNFPDTDVDLALSLHFLGVAPDLQPPSPDNLVGISDAVQDGTQSPIEVVGLAAPVTGTYAVVVSRNGSKKPMRLNLFTTEAINDGNNVPDGSLVTPADADGALTVAALDVAAWTMGPVEAFSSRGPTLAIAPTSNKPDITGPDGITGTVENPFFGTSAAAPHVAGAAAVLLAAQPNLTAMELKQRLVQYAVPMGDPTEFGHGRLDITVDFFPPTPNPPLFDAVLTQAEGEQITLVAGALTDDTPPLEYRFEYVGKDGQGGSSSDWQSSNTFVDTGLAPNLTYKYRFQARDTANPSNQTLFSGVIKLRTAAQTPPAPKVVDVSSETVTLFLPGGNNPGSIQLALYFVSEDRWLNPAGKQVEEPFWAPIAAWKSVIVKKLDPVTSYQFKCKAKNAVGVETAFSPSAFAVTDP